MKSKLFSDSAFVCYFIIVITKILTFCVQLSAIIEWLEKLMHHKGTHVPQNTLVQVFLDVQLFVHFDMKSLASQVLFKVQKDLENLLV